VQILQTAGDDFRRARAAEIDQHNIGFGEPFADKFIAAAAARRTDSGWDRVLRW